MVKAVIIDTDVAKAATSGPGVATISEPVVQSMHILSLCWGVALAKLPINSFSEWVLGVLVGPTTLTL